MPTLNFKKEFVNKIRFGFKRQTIRQHRKNPIKEGDTLYLYSGMRTSNCNKIKTVKCKEIIKIIIVKYSVGLFHCGFEDVVLGPHEIFRNIKNLNKFAKKDGFKSWEDMRKFFKDNYGLPFKGILIKW